jgi:AAA+ ATPase superfamily predicted ATPase
MITNPFITYGYESPDYFCDRKTETQQLVTALTNGNHMALISPRRMGKTGLLHHCFAQPQLRDHYYTFLIDIYATKNLQDFVFQMGRSIVNRLKPWGQAALDRFLQIVSSLRTGISFDGQGNPSWNVEVGDITSAAFTLDEIFNYLQSADKHCIVAIDEFQTIAHYPETNTEALLRTYVQQCRNATFVFAGSQKSMMSEIFSSPARPFYQSVSMLFLGPVEQAQYIQFAQHHFTTSGKTIDEDAIASIYEQFDGVTWYVQKVLNQLFAITPAGEHICKDDVQDGIFQIIRQNEEAYKDTLYQLTAKQRDLFVAIGKEGKAQQITSAPFIRRYHLATASSVQKAASSLMNRQLVTHQQGVYEIYDKFLSLWLKSNL